LRLRSGTLTGETSCYDLMDERLIEARPERRIAKLYAIAAALDLYLHLTTDPFRPTCSSV
jgi:hypothetical protein